MLDDAVAGTPSASPQGIADFEAHGGALYQLFVVPMLTSVGPGYQTVQVNAAEMRLATDSIATMPTTSVDKATPDVSDAAQRLVASAGSFGVYDHAEGTALLTAFTQLAVECTKARHKPSWFEPVKLTNH